MQRHTSISGTRRRSLALGLLGTLMITLAAACSDDPGPLPPTPVVRVEVTPATVELQVGDTHELQATPRAQDGKPLSGRSVTWRSSDESVARVDHAGKVAALQQGTVTITASSEGRSGAAQLSVVAVNAAPMLGALAPMSVQAGGPDFTLTITGTGFTPNARVRVNTVPRSFTYVSETELRANLTAADIASVGDLEVTVVNLPPGGGVSNALTFAVTPAQDKPAPQVASLSPSSAVAGGQTFTLVVKGSHFAAGATVRWNGADRPTHYVDATELRASIPAADVAQSGTTEVTVVDRSPGGGVSNAVTFTVTPAPRWSPAPQIASLFPRWAVEGGEAFTMVVRGSGFTDASVVRWNDAERPTVFVSATELRASIVAADLRIPGVARVSVFNPAPGGGTAQVNNYDVAPITRLPLHMLRDDYRKHATQLAVRTMEREGPVEIPAAVVDRFHEVLMRVAELSHPARDSVVDYFRVFAGEERETRDVWVQLDPSVPWVQNLRLGARSTGSAQVDSLMDRYDLALVEYTGFQWGSQARFRSAAPLNAAALALRFHGIEGVVHGRATGRFGYRRDIQATNVGSAMRLEYRVGWGDCLSVCTSWHTWTFDVQPDGSVVYRGSAGPELPAPNRI
jgi:hypothetical protein